VIKSCAAYLEADDSLDIRNLDLDCSPHTFQTGYNPVGKQLIPFKEEDHKVDGMQIRSMLWNQGGVTPTLCVISAGYRDCGMVVSVAKMTEVVKQWVSHWKPAAQSRPEPSIHSSESKKADSSSLGTVTASVSAKSVL